MRALMLAACAIGVAAPAFAAIETVDFRGSGVVTASRVGPDPGLPQPVPPAIGAPVTVAGSLFFGDAAIADDFTGVFTFDELEVFNGTQGFAWGVNGGGTGAATSPRNFAYAFGSATFAAGRLTGLNLYVDNDGDDHQLSTTGWATSYSFQDVDWRGSWALAVPEPSSWAMLIAGFGLVGGTVRMRRVAA